MVRQARIQSQTEYYHIIMRGNNRESIFAQQWQKEYFKELLMEKIEDQLIDISGYCIMDNHVHLIIKAEIGLLSKAMKSINIKFAMKYNRDNKRSGHVFQDRFKSETIENENYLIQVIRYVHNNPVKAKMVKSPSEYRWSSYNEYIGQNIIVSNEQKEMILDINNGINQFIISHKEEDNNEYLEIKEDIDKFRLGQAQEIISKYLQEKEINETKEINKCPQHIEELIKDLLNNTKLSHRKIANLLEVSNNIVHAISSRKSRKP